MLVSNDPRPISRTNIVNIYISTRFLIIRFHISGEYSSENSFLCLLKSCAKHSWTYITLCERAIKPHLVLIGAFWSSTIDVILKNVKICKHFDQTHETQNASHYSFLTYT
jgi:hypothetical protein